MTSSISLTNKGTYYYGYTRYISLNTLFIAKLTSYEIKLLEDVDYCQSRAKINEKNNRYCLFKHKI